MQSYGLIGLLLVCFCSFNHNDMMAQNDVKLIYVGDPMCSWCYGFEPEFSKVLEAHPDLDFELVLGGLRPEGEQTMSELKEFLRSHWLEIGELTGQSFSLDILEMGDYVYDTEPACRATVAAAKLDESAALPFFKAVQFAFYKQNKSTHDINTYLTIAESMGLDKAAFEKIFTAEETKAATKEHFARAAEMGIRGFPSVMLLKDGQYHLLANGYTDAEKLNKRLEKVINN